MNIVNYEKVKRLMRQLETLEVALKDIGKFLDEYCGDSDGSYCLGESLLYSFYLHECEDGSGQKVDLTGCMLGYSILHYVEERIEKRIAEVKAEIEKL